MTAIFPVIHDQIWYEYNSTTKYVEEASSTSKEEMVQEMKLIP